MSAFPWGALISAGSSLLGGLIGKDSSEKAQEAATNNAIMQADLQREFAKNSIRWRVEDAKSAGIHPLAALGNPGISYAPVSVGGGADMSMANAVASAGQDIGRAVNATRTQDERDTAYLDQVRAMQLEAGRLDNEIKRTELQSRIGRLYQTSSPPMPGPDYPIPGQPQSGKLFKNKPGDLTTTAPGKPDKEPFANPDVGYSRTSTGYAPVPGKETKERMEDMGWMITLPWVFRNLVLPTLQQDLNPPRLPPPGTKWWYNAIRQQYELRDVPGPPRHGSQRFRSYTPHNN